MNLAAGSGTGSFASLRDGGDGVGEGSDRRRCGRGNAWAHREGFLPRGSGRDALLTSLPCGQPLLFQEVLPPH